MFVNQPLCCDARQITEFANKIKMAANLLKNCASCWANFRAILCQQMCSPDQSTFMEVGDTPLNLDYVFLVCVTCCSQKHYNAIIEINQQLLNNSVRWFYNFGQFAHLTLKFISPGS